MKDLERREVLDLIAQGAQVVEVLGAEEFDENHLPSAINIALRTIETDGPKRLNKNSPVVVYCWDSA